MKTISRKKLGPKPRYGEREEIHVQVPIEDLAYVRMVTDNITQWVTKAIQEKRQREQQC